MPASGLRNVGSSPLASTNVPSRDEPHRNERRERQRGDREVQAGDAQRRNADEHGDGRAHQDPERDGDTPRKVVQAEDSRVTYQLHRGEPTDGPRSRTGRATTAPPNR